MTDAYFLKSEAEDAVLWALMSDTPAEYSETSKEAGKAVKAWAKSAGVSTAEAWITLIRDDRAYAQEVIAEGSIIAVKIDSLSVRDLLIREGGAS